MPKRRLRHWDRPWERVIPERVDRERARRRESEAKRSGPPSPEPKPKRRPAKRK